MREMPSKRVEHWSYRIVKGQRCWYPDSERAAGTKAIKSAQRDQAPKAQVPKSAQRAPKGEALPTHAPIVELSEPQAAMALAAGADRVVRRDALERIPVATTIIPNVRPEGGGA